MAPVSPTTSLHSLPAVIPVSVTKAENRSTVTSNFADRNPPGDDHSSGHSFCSLLAAFIVGRTHHELPGSSATISGQSTQSLKVGRGCGSAGTFLARLKCHELATRTDGPGMIPKTHARPAAVAPHMRNLSTPIALRHGAAAFQALSRPSVVVRSPPISLITIAAPAPIPSRPANSRDETPS